MKKPKSKKLAEELRGTNFHILKTQVHKMSHKYGLEHNPLAKILFFIYLQGLRRAVDILDLISEQKIEDKKPACKTCHYWQHEAHDPKGMCKHIDTEWIYSLATDWCNKHPNLQA